MRPAPPALIPFTGDWPTYENEIYAVYLQTFAHAKLTFQGLPVSAAYRPAYRDKGYGFWHVTSEAPDRSNRNEEDRIPDLRRCERIAWIGWLLQNSEGDGVSWWENIRNGETRVVIWDETNDFVVVLAKRSGYFVLKTAFTGIKPHRRKQFEQDRAAFKKKPQKD